MNWDTILPGLQALFIKLTGLQTFDRDRPQAATKAEKKAKLEFSVNSCVAVGEDEWRYLAPDGSGLMALTISGHRLFTLGVKCEGYDGTYNRNAAHYLERIYTRLFMPSSLATIKALGCSWVDAGPFVNLSAAKTPDNRVFSIGQKDFMFTAVVNEHVTDAADSPIPYIEKVELTSVYLYGVDGSPLTKQIGPVVIP